MDPLTHFLTGACLARTGFNRKAAYATLAMTLAAETPDLDVAWSIRGPVAAFQHHRGITHTFLALPVEAAVVLGAVWLVHRVRKVRRTQRESRESQGVKAGLTHAPVRWGLLYLFSLIALLSHLLLDWTNNYGIRPFFPFNPRWYAGSFVFIIEPVMLVLLAAALVMPALFGLVAGEVGVRRTAFRGRGWAVFALLAIVALWGVRYVEHDDALRLAANASYGRPDAPVQPSQVLRVTASPAPINPFLWHVAVETPEFFQLAAIDTRRGVIDTDPERDILPRPAETAATQIAKATWLGRVYLDWSSWPIVEDLGPAAVPGESGRGAPTTASGAAARVATEVTFRDLRFLYDAPTIDWRRNPPLSGQVFVDSTQPEGRRVVALQMDGHLQR